jgi:Cu2+-exporting ATPase
MLAQASPEDKLQALRQRQAAGEVVCVVGDGVNDAPVLAAADCSLAMGGGSESAQQGADAVITSQDPHAVVYAMAIAQATHRLVAQNLTWAVAYNIAAIPMALLGWLPPWLAGLGMAASSLAVMLNAQRVSQVSFSNRPDSR